MSLVSNRWTIGAKSFLYWSKVFSLLEHADAMFVENVTCDVYYTGRECHL